LADREAHAFVEAGRVRIERHCGVPKVADGVHAAAVVPDVGGDQAARSGGGHRRDGTLGVGHEVEGQARDGYVDGGRGQVPGVANIEADTGIVDVAPAPGDVVLRRVHAETSAGSQRPRMAVVRAPVLQPTSNHRRPAGTLSHERNSAATGRLQRPM